MTRIWVPGYDEVLELFERYKRQDKNIERAKEKLMSICWQQTSYIRKDPTRAFHENPALLQYIERKEALTEALCKQLDSIKELEKEVLHLLEMIDDPHRKILRMYYVNNYTWQKIAIETHYNLYHCLELRDNAIARLAAIQTNTNKTG